MAKKAKRAESTWRLPSCPTNEQVWNPRWEETRGLRAIARRGSLVAVNSFGTVRLFDIADPHAVETLGAIALSEGSHALSEGAPIGFDREGHVVLAGRECLHVVDVTEPEQPRLVTSRPVSPAIRSGTFDEGLLYRSAVGEAGLFVHDGEKVTRFAPEIDEHSYPATFARCGEFLYTLSNSDDLHVYRVADGARVRSKSCDVAYDAIVLPVAALQVLVVVSRTGLQIIDIAKPDNPKIQKRVFKHEPTGAGVLESTLYVMDGEYQKPQSITRIALSNPISSILDRESFTEDPELGSGLLFVDVLEKGLLIMTTTGRFAVLSK